MLVIVVAGLTPAWQQILVFDRLTVGEVNRALQAHWCASGKVLNVGVALAHLKAEAITIAPLGGIPRASIEAEFSGYGARHQWISTATPTRVCTTLLDRSTGLTTELVENAGTLAESELAEFCQAVRAAAASARVIVLTGSLAQATPTTFWRDLLAALAGQFVLDVRGEELLTALEHRPLVVKPNREELALTLGRSLQEESALLAGMRELNARGARWVVVTDGSRPVWMTSASEAYRLHPTRVEQVVNPIGSGDCLAAGVAWAIDEGRPMVEAVQLGMAAAAENVGQPLPARLSAAAVRARAQEVQIERVV